MFHKGQEGNELGCNLKELLLICFLTVVLMAVATNERSMDWGASGLLFESRGPDINQSDTRVLQRDTGDY